MKFSRIPILIYQDSNLPQPLINPAVIPTVMLPTNGIVKSGIQDGITVNLFPEPNRIFVVEICNEPAKICKKN